MNNGVKTVFRIVVITCFFIKHQYLHAQVFFIEPTIQSKIRFASRDDWGGPKIAYSYSNVTFYPVQVFNQELSRLDFGLNFGYIFENGNTLSIGIAQETPQIAFKVYSLTYDSMVGTNFINNIACNSYLFLTKFPVNYSFHQRNKYYFSKRIMLARYFNLGLSFIKIKKEQYTDPVIWSTGRINSSTWLGVSTEAYGPAGIFPFVNVGYNFTVSGKKRELFTIKIFAEKGFRTIFVSKTTMTFTSANEQTNILAYNRSKSTGIGIQISRKFKFLSRELKAGAAQTLE